jgi:hypothetical protein
VPAEMAGAGKEEFAIGLWAVQVVEHWTPLEPLSQDALTSSTKGTNRSPN